MKTLWSAFLLLLHGVLRGRERTAGLEATIRQLRFELDAERLHRKGTAQARHYAGESGHKLHLGCGGFPKEGWVNADLVPQADLLLDLRLPNPLPDGSCSLIYSEHFFEHVAYPGNARELLADYLRLLEPGGKVSFSVPDGEMALKAYAEGEEEFFRITKERWHPKWAETRMAQINYMWRQDGEHLFIYDEETLVAELERAGFVEARRREFDPELDREERRWGSLLVEGVKPSPSPSP